MGAKHLNHLLSKTILPIEEDVSIYKSLILSKIFSPSITGAVILSQCVFAIVIHPYELENQPRIIGDAAALTLLLLLSVLSVIDIYHMKIPTKVSKLGIIIGLSYISLSGLYINIETCFNFFVDSFLALIISFIFMRSISLIAKVIYKKNLLGVGDAYLASMGGAWLGVNGINNAISLAFISGSVFSLLGRFTGRLKYLDFFPFGPFLALGIWGVCLFELSLW